MKSAMKNNEGSIFIKWVLMFKCTITKLTVEAKLLMEELKVDTVKNWNSIERIDTVHIDLRIIM